MKIRFSICLGSWGRQREREMETKGERDRLVQGCILSRKQLCFHHHLRKKQAVKFGEFDLNLPFLFCPLCRPCPLCLHATSTVHLYQSLFSHPIFIALNCHWPSALQRILRTLLFLWKFFDSCPILHNTCKYHTSTLCLNYFGISLIIYLWTYGHGSQKNIFTRFIATICPCIEWKLTILWVK